MFRRRISRRAVVWLVLLAEMTGAAAQGTPDLEKRARAGDAEAQFRLGLAYWNGVGTPVDLGQAAYWYRQSAERGNAQAEWFTGWRTATGWAWPKTRRKRCAGSSAPPRRAMWKRPLR